MTFNTNIRLRPLERRLLRWRNKGVPVEELAPKFKRSPEHLRRVLALADMKRGVRGRG